MNKTGPISRLEKIATKHARSKKELEKFFQSRVDPTTDIQEVSKYSQFRYKIANAKRSESSKLKLLFDYYCEEYPSEIWGLLERFRQIDPHDEFERFESSIFRTKKNRTQLSNSNLYSFQANNLSDGFLLTFNAFNVELTDSKSSFDTHEFNSVRDNPTISELFSVKFLLKLQKKIETSVNELNDTKYNGFMENWFLPDLYFLFVVNGILNSRKLVKVSKKHGFKMLRFVEGGSAFVWASARNGKYFLQKQVDYS